MKDGFIRVAAGTPDIIVADTKHNADQIIKLIDDAARQGAALLTLPELCVTGYTCGDLFFQRTLLEGAEEAARRIIEATEKVDMLVVFGCPVVVKQKLYNCALVAAHGELLGIVPKQNIPNYGEFYELRNFTPGSMLPTDAYLSIDYAGAEYVRFGTDVVFQCSDIPEFAVGVEICEDLWIASPPSNALAAAGATVIVNLSASDEVVCKDDYRRRLVTEQSARLICGYIYADAGEGESTTDVVFSGHSLIAENGRLLREKKPFSGSNLIMSELDVQLIASERRRMNTYSIKPADEFSVEEFSLEIRKTELTRIVDPHPFVPSNEDERANRCEHILNIQTHGLKKRLSHAHAKCAVVAVSGGLDSTLALLVTVRAMDMLGRSRSDIITISMPGFGTTGRTRSNAQILCEELGVSYREIDINEAVRVHFRDIGHDEAVQDVTYENSQARERTQIAMDIANKYGGMLIGTGDMSELALGWATYNGDHMSMYGVNASVPKTLVRHIVRYCAECAAEKGDRRLSETLLDILDTPVSPELLPASGDEISQKTEDIVGPYELHDFFLYHLMRGGYEPEKLYRMAKYAFADRFSDDVILKWLKTFIRRFFMQQFKRSCLPDGPKVGSVALSPRGDLRMPSDAAARLWLERLDEIK